MSSARSYTQLLVLGPSDGTCASRCDGDAGLAWPETADTVSLIHPSAASAPAEDGLSSGLSVKALSGGGDSAALRPVCAARFGLFGLRGESPLKARCSFSAMSRKLWLSAWDTASVRVT